MNLIAQASTSARGLLALAGCRAFHTDLTDAEFTQRVHDEFDAGMTTDQVRAKIRVLRIDKLRTWTEDDPEDGITAGDIGAEVWPKRVLVSNPMDYYARDIILFRFGGDDALDDVVRRPLDWRADAGNPLVIDLHESEAAP